jgi:hypothetical protein
MPADAPITALGQTRAVGVNPTIEFGFSADSRTAPVTWTQGTWVDLTPTVATTLSREPRIHRASRERVYVTGIRSWVSGEEQANSIAYLTVEPAAQNLTSGDGGRDRAWWLWARVTGIAETPVQPIGSVRVYGA